MEVHCRHKGLCIEMVIRSLAKKATVRSKNGAAKLRAVNVDDYTHTLPRQVPDDILKHQVFASRFPADVLTNAVFAKSR